MEFILKTLVISGISRQIFMQNFETQQREINFNYRSKSQELSENSWLLNGTLSQTKVVETMTKRSEENISRFQKHLKVSGANQRILPRQEPSFPFEDIINRARHVLQLETLVLFANPKNLSKYFQKLSTLPLNKIIITQPPSRPLSARFNGHILSLVFIENSILNWKLLNTLKKSLQRWHLKKFLIITDFTLKEELTDQLLDLFEWLHKEGFWNSLLMDSRGNTVAMDHFSLKLLRNTVSVEQFFHLTTNWRDFSGYPVHVSMANNPPRALLSRDHHNKVQLKGYFGTLINIFAQIYNASLVPHQISDLDYYRELDCLKYIAENKVDLCGDAMALSPHYVIANPVKIASSYLMVPYDKPLPQLYYFLKPFQSSVWFLICSTFLFNILALSLIHRLQHKTWSCSRQLLYIFLSFIHLPFELKRVKGPVRRHLEMLLILLGFVISNWYLSLLASLLYTRLYSQDIQTLNDLQRLNLSIMVNEFEYSLLNDSAIDPIIKQQLILAPDNLVLENRRSLNPHYAYYSQYDKNSFYLHQQKFLLRPLMKELRDQPINSVLGGIPMRSNWPFEHLLNNIMNHILESGLFERLLLDALEDGISSGYLKYFATEHCYVVPLSLEYFQMPGIILMVGCFMGFISFIIEILYFKWNENKCNKM